MSTSAIEETFGAVLPLPLLPAAAALVADYTTAGHRVIADDLAARFGRPVTGRHAGQIWTQRQTTDPAEAARLAALRGRRSLQTGAPLLCREVRLLDQAPPHRPLAYSQEMLVPDRLPPAVLAELQSSGEPADRLFTKHGLDWTAEMLADEGYIAPLAQAILDLSWLEPDAVLVELVRRILVDGLPVGLVLDQLPLLPAQEPVRATA